jgi:hypothetical protein
MISKRIAANIAKLGAACAFSALIVASSHAVADDTTSALLDVLKAKGAITQAEYDNQSAPTAAGYSVIPAH